jgi:hypothetical protein
MIFNKKESSKKNNSADEIMAQEKHGNLIRSKRLNVMFASAPVAIMYQISTMTPDLRADVGIFGSPSTLAIVVTITLAYLYIMANFSGGIIASVVNSYLKSNSAKLKSKSSNNYLEQFEDDKFQISREMGRYTASRIYALTAMLSFLMFAPTYAFTGATSTITIPLLFAVSVYEIKKETGLKLSQSAFATIYHMLASIIASAIVSFVFVYALFYLSAYFEK